MARPKLPPGQNKGHKIPVRVNDAEQRRLEAAAARDHLPEVSSWLRRLAMLRADELGVPPLESFQESPPVAGAPAPESGAEAPKKRTKRPT